MSALLARIRAVHVFAIIVILIGIGISYEPPKLNGSAIWELVTMFVGYAIRDLFGTQPKE